MSVSGKTVLITGAARGIGAATARELHRRGAKLLMTDVDAEPLSELAAELGD
ncbi:MAG TPA: SDR family NAD(P)-dependent oxidoreductase, partial [Solirubrobacteraceae bacterium]|nr:SDR family NAD(P)-dependent oxidoreductase [Solirubrobacteraceae bacterium]